MKLLPFLLIVLAFEIPGQTTKPQLPTIRVPEIVSTSDGPSREHPVFEADERERFARKWKFLSETATDPKSTFYYKEASRNRDGDAEVWIKVVPPPSIRIIGRGRYARRYAYVLQFYVFHCRDKRYSIDSTIFYDARGRTISLPGSLLREYRTPISPDSVNEGNYSYFCQR